MPDDQRSLKQTFSDAERLRESITTSYDTTSSSYTDSVSQAIKDYQSCLDQISRLSLFSPNESVEDISTSNLPYLLVNFHLAELIQRLPSSSPQGRKQTLTSAREAYERYLHQLDSYSLLKPVYKKLLEEYTDSPTTFSTISSNTADAAARRNAKITNFKVEKELRAKLEYLRSRPEYAASELDDDDGNTEHVSGSGAGDEEAVRSVHLAHIEYCAHMSFQALESLNLECQMLAQAPDPDPSQQRNQQLDQDVRERRRQEREQSDRLDQPLRTLQSTGPILSPDGRPLKPFTLLNNRQELARGVFRPGHNLPTMTIDEYLEEERRRGGIIEGGGEASGQRPEPDEDNYDKADAETYKARAWDEFTEANPKGSGNTLNRG
ncbi:TAP42-like protein [Diplogelasinospora grovesii]|uniref:TAP42-like protein n=1 Tax=Diplogelasinospora grovesii TaxID=303347 RepID=A0AAN6NHM2_9PEZI|nr:TAP42-like protein [Diplogelasinospora grovesii]